MAEKEAIVALVGILVLSATHSISLLIIGLAFI